MHEVSLVESVLELIEDSARSNGVTRVKKVVLEIGQLANVEPEAMSFCFEAVTRGSIAEGAILEMLASPGLAWCMSCQRSVEIPSRNASCPECGGYTLQVTGGAEMRVKSIEVEA
ncbi:hydrogenase maturation nickel metallochaperone HypA [Uliginosibacterium gangwonense]|uniref:hydrogenase maturation nickel metallochaperone HypA n=1 Tax=Uliginosibacterium gangwonense TaxID=392736 RepID=UPI00036EEEF7|nr:hydrogenase maturation nickel metallochaperone HypA [Uliginosibacterium gangwonense]